MSTDALDLELGPYRLSVATGFGPRVLGVRLGAGPEMFANLSPEVVIDLPDSGIYTFRGGHRLWASPEVPGVTYAPDDEPCRVVSEEDRVEISGPIDRAGLTKSIAVHLAGDRLVVDHTLGNAGSARREVAPWAITQLRLGGLALVPTGSPVPDGPQASHSLVLWPYTDLSDPRLSWRQEALLVEAKAGPALKVGVGPAPSRLGYLIDGHVFIKELPPAGPGVYPDRGAAAQIYLNEAFCELESVGPISTLEPGSSISHREVWVVKTCDDVDAAHRRVVAR